MNIIKFIILLLFIFITTIDCSPYNHLDLQVSLLILAAGDHDGNIVKDKYNNPIKINISNDERKDNFASIIDIIPKLSKYKEDNQPPNKGKTKEETIKEEFKKLYI